MVLTAIFMGLAGSLHCLGMCSPLVMAVTNMQKPFLINRLVYNGGRIFCYGLLGAFVGAFGNLIDFPAFQNVLTVFLGSVLIALGLAGTGHIRIPLLTGAIQKITVLIKVKFFQFLQKKTTLSMAFMGMLNGLLPCGLTYLALTYCLTLPNMFSGFLFMLIFGAATLPMMLGVPSVLQSFFSKLNFSLRRFTTVVMIALGVFLVSRSVYVGYHTHVSRVSGPVVVCK